MTWSPVITLVAVLACFTGKSHSQVVRRDPVDAHEMSRAYLGAPPTASRHSTTGISRIPDRPTSNGRLLRSNPDRVGAKIDQHDARLSEPLRLRMVTQALTSSLPTPAARNLRDVQLAASPPTAVGGHSSGTSSRSANTASFEAAKGRPAVPNDRVNTPPPHSSLPNSSPPHSHSRSNSGAAHAGSSVLLTPPPPKTAVGRVPTSALGLESSAPFQFQRSSGEGGNTLTYVLVSAVNISGQVAVVNRKAEFQPPPVSQSPPQVPVIGNSTITANRWANITL